ncbi:MAG: asparagine synthase-related protein, partial [Candidatus Wallbacteria bacterium]|nr:asparagine synthase-related protein [Candidatus Wallbacteria bacterium]
FEGVLSVLPGHFLTVDCPTGAFRLERYWHPPVRETLKMSPGVAQDRFRELLTDSVQLRLQSDVPVGAFLSGGLDSTTICLLAGERVRHYYTAHFPDFPAYSEIGLARRVSAKLPGRHHEVGITPEGMMRVMRKNICSLECPPSGGASYLIHLIAEQAASDVRVMLDGNGGDEILAGYPRYRLMAERACFAFNAGKYSEKICRLSSSLRSSRQDIISTFSGSDPAAYFRIIQLIGDEEMHLFLRREFVREMRDLFCDRFLPQSASLQLLPLQKADISSFLVYLLEIQDKTTMAESLENRVPFLDHRLAEFVLSLPDSLRLGPGGVSKQLLRSSLSAVLPCELLAAPKMGTPKPDREWLQSGLIAGMMRETLSDGSHPVYRFLRRPGVLRTLRLHQSGKKNLSQRLWCFFNLAVFLEEFAPWM